MDVSFAARYGSRIAADVGFAVCFFVAMYLFIMASMSRNISELCAPRRLRFESATWLPVPLKDLATGNSLQGFAFDANGSLHTITRLGVDGVALRMPAGYSHVGASSYSTADALFSPLETDERRSSLLARFDNSSSEPSTCPMSQQDHAPWVALYANDTRLVSSDFDSVNFVCSYTTAAACQPLGCFALPSAFDGVQGGAMARGESLLLLVSEDGPCGRGITALAWPSLSIVGFAPVCMGPACLGELEGITVYGNRVVVGGNYVAHRIRMEFTVSE